MSNEFPSDINFGGGDNWVVVIHTRQYSGNFEREMAGYVFGAHDEDRGHGFAEAEEFNEAAQEDLRLPAIQAKITCQTHAEYGEVCNTIWPTPGRVNDGYGAVTDVTPETKGGYPAYESVAVFFDEALTEEELAICEQRAKEYCLTYPDYYGKGNDGLTFIGIEQFCVGVQISRKVTVK